MAFLNFLGGGNPLEALMSGASPGFAGGMFGGNQGPMIEGMGGLENALAQNQAQRPPQQPHKQKLGIGDIIGLIGDAARGWRGQQPVYGPMMQQRRQQQSRQEAMSNFLDDPQGAIKALMAGGEPELGLKLWQMTQGKVPEIAQELTYFGIDPKSEEGQTILKRKLMGAGQGDPNFIRELEALGIDPHSQEAQELFYGKNSPSGFLLKPRGGQSAAPNLQPGKVVNGYIYKGGNPNDQNSWEKAGGPTPQASGPFPASGH